MQTVKPRIQVKRLEKGQMYGVYRFILRNAITGEVESVQEYANLIPTVGREQLCKALASELATLQDIEVNYVALGTGATPPANGDVKLETETYRNLIASNSSANNVAYLSGFFTTTEVVGTFTEAGLFMNGTGAADSGVILSRVAISVTKAITQTLTVDWTLTIT